MFFDYLWNKLGKIIWSALELVKFTTIQFITWHVILIVVILILLCIYFRNYLRLVKLALELDGPKPVPIIGNTFMITRSKELTELSRICKRYGRIFKCWFVFLPIICLYHPEHLKIVLSPKVSQKSVFYSILHNFIGAGLITNNGEKWKNNRKLIQPFFHINILETFVSVFDQQSRSILGQLRENKELKISEIVNNCILNVVHNSILGVPVNAMNTDSPFRKGQLSIFYRVTRPWLLSEVLYKFTSAGEMEVNQMENLQGYTKRVLEQRLEQMQKTKRETTCLMDMFIEISQTNPEFTNEDIINESCTFMLAGQDSVGGAVTFALYYLAKHQDIQEKVVEELSTIFENLNTEQKVTIDDLNKMKYLEQCIKETLRLIPSIPVLSRELLEDIVLDNYTIPKGANILFSPYATQRLPEIFPDPLKFDPDRFLPENAANIPQYAYLPFSQGPRNCIGYKFAFLEIKTVISTILRNYHIHLCPGKEELELIFKITLRAKGGVWLTLKKRHDTVSK